MMKKRLANTWCASPYHPAENDYRQSFLFSDNIVVMWIVLIRENVTAGVSGRIDKELKKRLEMMWCQHGCHSCKEQEVYNAVRTTQLHTVTTETIDTPFTPKDT